MKKKTKPMDPREADLLNRRIMWEMKYETARAERDRKYWELINSEWFQRLPLLTQYCLRDRCGDYEYRYEYNSFDVPKCDWDDINRHPLVKLNDWLEINQEKYNNPQEG